MKKQYTVKHLDTQKYYGGKEIGWLNGEPRHAHLFDFKEDAKEFISNQDGKFTIETVYEP